MSLGFCPLVLQPQMGLPYHLSLLILQFVVSPVALKSKCGRLPAPTQKINHKLHDDSCRVILKTVVTSQHVIGLYTVVK